MRAMHFGIALLLITIAGCVTLARVQQPTNIEFGANNENGMLVVAEYNGTATEAGRYRFLRIDRETRRALGHVDVEVGVGRGSILFGRRPGAPITTHTFHYALVPAGDYALIYMNASGTNIVTYTERWACLSGAAAIYHVAPGSIAVVRAPDRPGFDIYQFSALARRNLISLFPPGTTIADLQSEEKAAQDFAEIAATNTLLTAPHRVAPPIGTLAFQARERGELDDCTPGQTFTITSAT